MSTTTTLAEASTAASGSPGPMLVCAAEPGREEAHVSLADGVYETTHERVFWRGTPDREVLRLPLELPVATRPLRGVPQQRSAATAGGEQELLRAIQAGRRQRGCPEAVPTPSLSLGLALRLAVQTGDLDLTFAEAVLLWKQAGLRATYGAMSRALSGLASNWAAGTGTVVAEHRATRTVSRVADRLAALTPDPASGGTVILTVPAGEQHTLALTALAHLIREAGRPVQVVDELPVTELAALAATPGTIAVLVSVHTPRPGAEVRSLMSALRTAAPEVLLALGGPGVPQKTRSTFGADLVSDDVGEFLTRLGGCSKALTDRESQVLTAVANGRTNGEIAQLLGVAPATVKSHLDNIFSKTQTEHRAGAVAQALRRGWIA